MIEDAFEHTEQHSAGSNFESDGTGMPVESGNGGSVPDRVVYQIEESRSGSVFLAVCPELLITAFGDTAQDARIGLRQQVAEYLEDCDNLGVLDETLIAAGFYYDLDPDTGDGVWMSNEVKPVDGPDIVIL